MSVLIPWGRKCYHFHFYLFLSQCHLVYILCIFFKPISFLLLSEWEEPLCPGAADAAGALEFCATGGSPCKPVVVFLCPLLETDQEWVCNVILFT